jgi:hypothetical protein
MRFYETRLHPVAVSVNLSHGTHEITSCNTLAPEPQGSSQCSQEPATGPYPEPTEYALHPS